VDAGYWMLDFGYSMLDFVLRISHLGARVVRRMLDNLMLDT
jgi:hypothetical protein